MAMVLPGSHCLPRQELAQLLVRVVRRELTEALPVPPLG